LPIDDLVLIIVILAVLVVSRATVALLVILIVVVLVVARAAEALLVILIVVILVVARAAKGDGGRAVGESESSHCIDVGVGWVAWCLSSWYSTVDVKEVTVFRVQCLNSNVRSGDGSGGSGGSSRDVIVMCDDNVAGRWVPGRVYIFFSWYISTAQPCGRLQAGPPAPSNEQLQFHSLESEPVVTVDDRGAKGSGTSKPRWNPCNSMSSRKGHGTRGVGQEHGTASRTRDIPTGEAK
jgi:hypothetical protein